ncbi:lysine decarboxylase, putative [Plasmodium gallinaceum]|uniref:Lysine decarboxylase, putative n=1 Tax=Plasmodium gallinaceum TaxID=5849 RepID=A0A1J1H057_PLAGA|nr:lysine decarboxylase, putative [Plasmodium gallinaceum]CRG98129.1 lysine decarboxylase, putative [Plasmodium gallinaceum]
MKIVLIKKIKNINAINDYINNNAMSEEIESSNSNQDLSSSNPLNLARRNKKEKIKLEKNKYDKIYELEKYININNATNVSSLRIKLWEALLLYINNLNIELVYFIISCLEKIEVYWGQEATDNLQEIINLINDKKYKDVSNKIGETLSSLSVTTGKTAEDNPFFYTLIVSAKRDENSHNYNSDLACELNKILQYEHNRLSNQNNNKKLEYKIIEVSNAEEALLACLINSQILSVVLVDNLTIDEENSKEKEYFNFTEENSLNNNCANNSYLNCNGTNNTNKTSLTHSMHNGSTSNNKDVRNIQNYRNNSNNNMNENKKVNGFIKNDYKFYIKDFVLGYEQLVHAPVEKMKKGFNSLVILIKSIAYIRSSIDIFCVCTSITLDKLQSVNNMIIRIFTTHDDHSDLHESILDGVKKKIKTPFFNALKSYAERPIGVFHALAISKGNSVRRSRWIQSLLDFYGVNLFKAESSATCGGLDSLLDPHGSLKEAQLMAARAYGSKYCFFVTNGTSSSNKIVMQALVKPGDIILVDRACHKSHHYGFVLCQALPCYLDPYPVSRYGIYGAVPIYVIKKTLLEYRNSNKLHLVKLLILTNCTFDGIVYNVKRVIEECLAIKPDLIFLFDEAWFAYACFHPILKFRTAMTVADKMRSKEQKKIYYKIHKKLLKKFGNVKSLNEVSAEKLLKTRLYPNPSEYKVRVYATQSIHKSLTSLRQGSIILISDDNFESHAYTPFKEAYFTHMSTSPNYQILATLDAGRAQMELEGYGLVEKQAEAAFLIRKELNDDPMISRYFRTLNAEDLIPDSLRQCAVSYIKKKKKMKDYDSSDSKYSGNITYSCNSNSQVKGLDPSENLKYPIKNMSISYEYINASNAINNNNVFLQNEFTNNNAHGNSNTEVNNVCRSNNSPSSILNNKNERSIDLHEKNNSTNTYNDNSQTKINSSLKKKKKKNDKTLNSITYDSNFSEDTYNNLSFLENRNKNYNNSSYSGGMKNFLEYFESSWLSEDEFVLDPTRITLFTGYSGIDGDTFKVKWLMDKYGIQINKTSINSVLFQTNIGTTGSSCLFLKSCLSLISQELDQKKSLFNERDLNQFNENVYNLVSNYIELSEFSEFHPLFKKKYANPNIFNKEGDLRKAFYLAYEEDYVEYILLGDLKERIKQNEMIVSASFIIPYPPGFPVLVPGQIVSQEIVDYLSGLSVKEIHGYDENLGFRCFYNFILDYFFNMDITDPYSCYQKIDKKTYNQLKFMSLSKKKNIENIYDMYIYDNETNKMKKLYLCNGKIFKENNIPMNVNYNFDSYQENANNNVIGIYENLNNNVIMPNISENNTNNCINNGVSNNLNDSEENIYQLNENEANNNILQFNKGSITSPKKMSTESIIQNTSNDVLLEEKKMIKFYDNVNNIKNGEYNIFLNKIKEENELKYENEVYGNNHNNNKLLLNFNKIHSENYYSQTKFKNLIYNSNNYKKNYRNYKFHNNNRNYGNKNYIKEQNRDFNNSISYIRNSNINMNVINTNDNNRNDNSLTENNLNNEEKRNIVNKNNNTIYDNGNSDMNNMNSNFINDENNNICNTNNNFINDTNNINTNNNFVKDCDNNINNMNNNIINNMINNMNNCMNNNNLNSDNMPSFSDVFYRKKTNKFNKSDDGIYSNKLTDFVPKLKQSNIILYNKIKKNALIMQKEQENNMNYLNDCHLKNNYLNEKNNKDNEYYSDSSKKVNENISIKDENDNFQKKNKCVKRDSLEYNFNKIENNDNEKNNIMYTANCISNMNIDKEDIYNNNNNYVNNNTTNINENLGYNINYYPDQNINENIEEICKTNELSIRESERNNLNNEILDKNEFCNINNHVTNINSLNNYNYDNDEMINEMNYNNQNVNENNNNNINNHIKNELTYNGNNFNYQENEIKKNSILRENEIDKNSRKSNTLNNNSYINNLITNVDDDTFVHKQGNFFLECALTNSEINCSSFEMDVSLNNIYSNGESIKQHRNYDNDKKKNEFK